jgi:hypothetical protein
MCDKVFVDDKAVVSHENTEHHHCHICVHRFETMDELQKVRSLYDHTTPLFD